MTRADLNYFRSIVESIPDAMHQHVGFTLVHTLERVFDAMDTAMQTGEGINTTKVRAALEDRTVTTVRGEV